MELSNEEKVMLDSAVVQVVRVADAVVPTTLQCIMIFYKPGESEGRLAISGKDSNDAVAEKLREVADQLEFGKNLEEKIS